MKKLLCLLVLLLFSGLAFGQATPVPICNGFDVNGVPINTASGSRTVPTISVPATGPTALCLLARSLATHSLQAVADTLHLQSPLQILPAHRSPARMPGSYPIVVSGVITGFTGGTGGTNYTAPVITITDATGSGASSFSDAGSALCRRRTQICRCLQEFASCGSGYDHVSRV